MQLAEEEYEFKRIGERRKGMTNNHIKKLNDTKEKNKENRRQMIVVKEKLICKKFAAAKLG